MTNLYKFGKCRANDHNFWGRTLRRMLKSSGCNEIVLKPWYFVN